MCKQDGFNTLLERGVKGLQADTKRMTVNAYVMNCLTAGYSKVPIEAQVRFFAWNEFALNLL